MGLDPHVPHGEMMAAIALRRKPSLSPVRRSREGQLLFRREDVLARNSRPHWLRWDTGPGPLPWRRLGHPGTGRRAQQWIQAKGPSGEPPNHSLCRLDQSGSQLMGRKIT